MVHSNRYEAAMARSAAAFVELRGSAKGRPVFVLGTGPSAKDFNLTPLKHELTISVNGFGRIPSIEEISPSFHLVADPSAWNPVQFPTAFADTLSGLSFLDHCPTQLILPMNYAEMTLDHPAYQNWAPLYFQYTDDPTWPIDFSRPVPTWGQNILNIGLMFCLHLEAKEVFLVGFDNGGVIDRLSDHVNFYPAAERFEEAVKVYDDAEMRRCMGVHLNQLHALKRIATENGMGIYTCSKRGSFRMFPYLDFNSLDLAKLPEAAAAAEESTLALPERPAPTGGILSRIFHYAQDDPGVPALHLLEPPGWRTVTRGALADSISRYAANFSTVGRPGSLILFLKRTDEDLLAAYLGAIAAGRVPAQLSPPTAKVRPEEHTRWMNHLLNVTKAEILFTDPDFPHECLLERQLTWLSPEGPWVQPGQEPFSFADRPDNLALAQMSSGTTGLQKAVFLTHQGILDHMDSYGKAIGLRAGDVVISWLPLYHDMGLMAAYLMPLMAGVPLVLMDPFRWISNPKLLVEAAERFSATITFLPNFAYQVLADKCPGRGLGGLRLFVNCSEPARPETHERFLEAFPDVDRGALSVCYAMAENTFGVSQTEPGVPPRSVVIGTKKVLSCGRILPGTDLRINAEDADGVGEVAIRGAFLFSRFLDGAEHLVDGFYPTGDLGKLEGGELFITGRKKDLIIVNGKNIYPQDVEHAASSCEGVYPGRTVCFGVENEAAGSEDLVVLVEPRVPEPGDDLLVRISNAVERESGIRPRHIGVVPHMSLTKTSSGKVSRMRNKELFLEGRLGSARC